MKLSSELKRAFRGLDNYLTTAQKEIFLSSYYYDLSRFQGTLGKYLTENFLRSSDNLFKEFVSAGILFADDMAMLTIVLYYMYLTPQFPNRKRFYSFGKPPDNF